MIKKIYNGYIIIPNEFSDENFWYIQKDNQNKNYLMKNNELITEVNQYITQGHFIKESMIEFFSYNTSDLGSFDFINGSYAPYYFSEIYSVGENNFFDGYYKEVVKKNSIFNDKVKRDNILVIF